MDANKLYYVRQGDGLKSHLSLDKDGKKAICGHKIEHYGKTVENFELFSFHFMAMMGHVCKRCLDVAGLDGEGSPKEV